MIPIKQILQTALDCYDQINTIPVELCEEIFFRFKSFCAGKDPVFDKFRSIVHSLTPDLQSEDNTQARVWCLSKKINKPITCTMCATPVKWDNALKGYRAYCSPSCKGKDITLKDKTAKTNFAKYGTKSPTQNAQIRSKIATKWESKANAAPVSYQLDQLDIDQYPVVAHTRKRSIYFTSNDATSWIALTSDQLINILKSHNVNVDEFPPTPGLKRCSLQAKIKQTLKNRYGTDSVSNEVDRLSPHSNTYPQRLPSVARLLNQMSKPSTGLAELIQFLTVDTNLNFTVGEGTVVPATQLDIYIANHKLAIEYCDLYWHSEQQGKGRHYHRRKYELCKSLGIQLLTIFEDEWRNRQQQIKNKILHLTASTTLSRVNARDTKVIVVDRKLKNQFFETNHIQGSGPGSLTYGLLHQGTVVAAMSFINQPDKVFALNRYATSVHVVGGFSKLLSHFKKNNDWTQLISFADQRISDGKLYYSTGWKLDSILPPDYCYSPDGINRIHKFNYRRKNLPKLLKHFDPDMSETENCLANNVLRLWDCGKLRFIQNNPEKS